MSISSAISRTNAAFLALVGLTLLFAADDVLPQVIPAFPATAAWFGQILSAALLSLAVFNWFNRSVMQGGIYGRPVVAANTTFYFISVLALLKVALRSDAPVALWIVLVPILIFAVIYAWLLFRGPFERDLATERGK
jgi:hypothetical protein